tara:strand:+ start:542 stop:1855 length:1314 start_codon:yes stop_codon:yes gene_type:complete
MIHGRDISTLDVEQRILGVLIDDKSKQEIILSRVEAQHFTEEKNKYIYNKIKALKEKNTPIDNFSVLNAIKTKVNAVELLEITNKADHTTNIDSVILALIQSWSYNQLTKTMFYLNTAISEEENDPFKIMDEVKKQIQSIETNMSNQEQTIDISQDIIDYIDMKEESKGVPTGYSNLDFYTRGWMKGCMIVLAARPGMGKTDFAINLAINGARHNKNCLFVSLEMSREELTKRIISTSLDISKRKVNTMSLSDKEKDNVIDNLGDITQNIYVDDKPIVSMSIIHNKILSLKRLKNIDLVIIDYLQLITEKSGNSKYEQITNISRQLKLAAKDANIPIIVLSQLSRVVESRSSTVPKLSDLRDSGAIEQDADQVLFLYRPSYYGINQNEGGDDITNLCEVHLAKNRHGEINYVPLDYDPSKGIFKDWNYTMTYEEKKI